MIRRIIQIDQDKCNGCGLCAEACHESAIGIVNGKATLLRDDYCDGLGDCLPACPMNAIQFVEREAAAYDEAAVQENKKKKEAEAETAAAAPGISRLAQWPCQIKLVSPDAAFFDGANLLIAADCTAYAYASMHEDFMKNRVTIIGCPKLDGVDYSEKLKHIFKNHDIQSITVVRMEVPCCGGLEYAAEKALKASKKHIPWQVVTISIDGKIL